MSSRKRVGPVAASSPCDRTQRCREQRDSSPDELCGRRSRSSSSCSTSDETEACGESSPQVDELSRSTNNISLGSPRSRRHSSPGAPPSLVRHRNEFTASRGRASSPAPSSLSLSPLWPLLLVVVVILGVAFRLYIQSAASPRQSSRTLSEVKSDLRKAFPQQLNETWITFGAQLRTHLRDNAVTVQTHTSSGSVVAPKDAGSGPPAVLLLVGDEKSETLPCLARRIGHEAAALLGGGSCRSVMAGNEKPGSEDADKLAMDKEVSDAYARGERCFLLSHLERLSKQPLLLMHSWCDHDHSPFQKALFLFDLRTEPAPKNSNDAESFLFEHLSKKVGPDEAGALNTRLANSIIIVQEEKDLDHGNSCVGV